MQPQEAQKAGVTRGAYCMVQRTLTIQSLRELRQRHEFTEAISCWRSWGKR